MRLTSLAFLFWSLLVSSAAAQAGSRWLVVQSHSGARTDWMDAAVSDIRDDLVGRGIAVWSQEQAATEVEARVSAPSSEIDDREIHRWMSMSDAAVNDLAEGNYDRALDKLNSAQAISHEAIETLSRDPERARRVLDTCLYVVRAELATQSQSRARAVARECRRLVPRGEPSPQMHPPAVTDLLAQVDALQAKQTGELRVESTPSGCAARLNGLLLGATPVSIGELFPGDYRLQVECGSEARGRVHEVSVGAGKTLRRVDWRFDETIETRPSLSLGYPDASEEREHRVLDARRLAMEIGADAIVLVSMPTADTLEAELIEIDEADSSVPIAIARLSAGAEGPIKPDLRSAARALTDRRCMDFTSPEPLALPCKGREATGAVSEVTDRWPAHRRPRGQFIAGLTLVGVGVAGLATGYALLLPRRDAALNWVNEVDTGGQDASAQQKWLDLRGAIIATGSVGSASLVAAMPLALPEREKTPWWAWVSGGVGLGLAGFSIARGVTAEAEPSSSCSAQGLGSVAVRSCVNRGAQTSVALLTGLTSAPLIAMPLVYLLRPSRARLEPQVAVGPNGAHLALRGQF
jgi:hypothetical protein